MKRYPIVYRIKQIPGGLTKAEVKQATLADAENGACDNLMLISIIGRPGGPGGLSTVIWSVDGETGEAMTPDQLWQLWTLMAHDLAESFDPGNPKGDLCRDVFEAVRQAVLARHGEH